jgi:hypothetical protein
MRIRSRLPPAPSPETPRYLQAAGVLPAPDPKILNAVYSIGPLGRLVAEEVIGIITL